MSRSRRTFGKEFKEEAVRQALAGDREQHEVAASLDISPSLLSKWINASNEEGSDAFRGRGKRTAMEEENWRLQRENKQLKEELEFLKKVSRYFAKGPK